MSKEKTLKGSFSLCGKGVHRLEPHRDFQSCTREHRL